MLLQLRMGKLHGMLRQRKEQIAFLQETHLVSELRQLATGENSISGKPVPPAPVRADGSLTALLREKGG